MSWMSSLVCRKKKDIKRQINNRLKNKLCDEQSLFALYPEYTEEKILEAVNSLGETKKKIIELKYGLNEKEKVDNKKISEILNIKLANIGPNISLAKKQIKTKSFCIIMGKKQTAKKSKFPRELKVAEECSHIQK